MSQLLSVKEVCAKVGVCRTTVYARMAAKTFPTPLKIGAKTVRWRADEIDAFIDRLSAARDSEMDL